jgi:hypothetical protein
MKKVVKFCKCGVATCKAKVRQFGVCGRHKKWAWKSEEEDFLSDLENYRVLTEEFDRQLNLLDNENDIIGIQKYWAPNDRAKPNLSNPPCREFAPEFKDVGEALAKMLTVYHEMAGKYDSALVYNACTRVRHSFNDCECQICQLGPSE